MTSFPPNLGVLVCGHVFSKERAVCVVSHETDGDWQFLCGQDDHDFDEPGQLRLVGVGHLLSVDQSLNQLAELAKGFEAERDNPDTDWTISSFAN